MRNDGKGQTQLTMVLSIILTLMMAWAGMANAKTNICANAPLPRLEAGERGEVAPGIDRLRLRALPAVGTGEVGLLHAGNSFEVIAGPSCNGGFAWWRVALADSTTGWVAEGDWTLYYLRPVSDAPQPLCKRADAPWLHLLLTAGCTLLGAV